MHTFGAPADIEALARHGIPVIEDCAHALGPRASGTPFGARGALSIGSFHATKLVGAGEGGIISTSNEKFSLSLREAREYTDKAPSASGLNERTTDVLYRDRDRANSTASMRLLECGSPGQ